MIATLDLLHASFDDVCRTCDAEIAEGELCGQINVANRFFTTLCLDCVPESELSADRIEVFAKVKRLRDAMTVLRTARDADLTTATANLAMQLADQINADRPDGLIAHRRAVPKWAAPSRKCFNTDLADEGAAK